MLVTTEALAGAPRMLIAALLLNVAVLVPVCAGLLRQTSWARQAYGDPTPARGILLSIYLAIAVASVVLLAGGFWSMARGLLLVQVLYKLTTPLTVGTLRHPVVLSNLGIAAFHALTLLLGPPLR